MNPKNSFLLFFSALLKYFLRTNLRLWPGQKLFTRSSIIFCVSVECNRRRCINSWKHLHWHRTVNMYTCTAWFAQTSLPVSVHFLQRLVSVSCYYSATSNIATSVLYQLVYVPLVRPLFKFQRRNWNDRRFPFLADSNKKISYWAAIKLRTVHSE